MNDIERKQNKKKTAKKQINTGGQGARNTYASVSPPQSLLNTHIHMVNMGTGWIWNEKKNKNNTTRNRIYWSHRAQ